MTSPSSSFMKQQFVVTHTIPRNETNTPSVTIYFKKKKDRVSLNFLKKKNITCFNVGLSKICQSFSVCCKTARRWVTTNCYFLSDTALSNADSLDSSAIRQFRKFAFLIPRSPHIVPRYATWRNGNLRPQFQKKFQVTQWIIVITLHPRLIQLHRFCTTGFSHYMTISDILSNNLCTISM